MESRSGTANLITLECKCVELDANYVKREVGSVVGSYTDGH